MNQQQALPKAANFGDLALTSGVNHEIDAQLIGIGPIEQTKAKGTRFQKCTLLDQSGNQAEATIWQGRMNTALAEINRNKWLTFSLSASMYKGKTQYGGFWQMEAAVITQAPPQAPQATNPTSRTIVQGRTLDAKDECICRQCAGKVAGDVVAAWITKEGINFDINGKLLEIADIMSMWFISGNAQAPEPQTNDPNNFTQDGQPF